MQIILQLASIMKVPEKPPYIEKVGFNEGTAAAMEFLANSGPEIEQSEFAHIKRRLMDYPHWSKVVHWPMPATFSSKDLWHALKLTRTPQMNELPLLGDGEHIRYMLPSRILEFLHWQDVDVQEKFDAAGTDSFLGGILKESFYSSLLEGAATTELIAKGIIRGERAPHGKGEWMVLNNHKTLMMIQDTAYETLTPDVVLDAHRMMTEGTLNDPKDCGRLRERDDIKVFDKHGNLLHNPPLSTELPERMQALCDFANGDSPDYFIHPVIRAMLVHFQLAYDHPFVDGNGRIARALFYRQMARAGYSYIKCVSISRLLTEAPARYATAFVHTETDGFDATYFLMHQCEVLRRAIADELARLARKEKQREQVRLALEQQRISYQPNHRQVALLEHALKNVGFLYFVEGHSRAHGISRQTASADLQELVDARLLMQLPKRGRSGRLYYRARPNLFKKLGRKNSKSQ